MASKLLVSALTAAALTGNPVNFAIADSEDTVASVNGIAITSLQRDTQAAQFKARGQNASDEQIVDELVQTLPRQQKNIQPARPAPMAVISDGLMPARWFPNFPKPSPPWSPANSAQSR